MFTYSLEHINFLKKIKRENISISIIRLLIIISFLITWELLARFSIINTFLFSSPSKVINTIIKLCENKELFKHIGVTLYEVFISFSFASVIGLIVSTILWRFKYLSRIVDPYITVINSLPKVALGPLIIIWVGASYNSIIFMALTISIFTTIINIYTGFINVDENYIIMLKSFNASKGQIFMKLILPSNILNIISTLKINISMSLIGLLPLVGEKIFFNKCYSRY